MRSAPTSLVVAGLLLSVVAGSAHAHPATAPSVVAPAASSAASSLPPAATQPGDDSDERAACQLLGPQYRVARSENFTLISGQRDWPVGFDLRLEQFCQDFLKSLSDAGFEIRKPESRLVWIGFEDRRAFDRYVAAVERMDLSWLDGYYSTRSNRVAVVVPGGPGHRPAGRRDGGAAAVDVELLHEASHQLSFNCGLLKRGVMYPLWVTEGLATNFEMGVREHGNANPERCGRLVDTRTGCELLALADLVVATRVPGDADEARQFYAQSWGLFHFLLKHKPAQMKRYLGNLAELPVGRRSPEELRAEFLSAFGAIDALEVQWDGFVAALDGRPVVARVQPPVVGP